MAKKKVAKKKVAKKKVAKKKVVKKKVVKKKVAKKKVAKKKVAKKKVAKKAAAVSNKEVVSQPVANVAKKVKKARTKGDIYSVLAESSGLSKKQINSLFDSLSDLIHLDVGKKGPGIFNLPGLMKIVRIHKPATKARKGINPFTKEPTIFKAKPAKNVVKIRVLKGLKDMV
tara:strand:+ start:490 stop:1002 length:513 start_codon:yes stop_codon:yes gene_type:complete